MSEYEIRIMAISALKRLLTNDSIALREQILETAQESKMLSVWLEVFADDADMCYRLQTFKNISQ